MSVIDLLTYETGDQFRIFGSADEPTFALADACNILEISNSRMAAKQLDPKDVTTTYTLTAGGRQRIAVVNESGLYELIFQSRKPEAKKFRRWITAEVLPSIRRTGSYSTAPALDPSTPAGVLAMAEQFASTARQLVLESEARQQLEAAVERQAPLVAKAEAHSASTKAIHRQEFAREVQGWAQRIHGIRVLQAHVFAFLAHKGMTIGGNRSDSGHATSHAIEAGWAWTDKGEAENGHRYATTKLEPKGQDLAWKWITKYVAENGTLELPREIGPAA